MPKQKEKKKVRIVLLCVKLTDCANYSFKLYNAIRILSDKTESVREILNCLVFFMLCLLTYINLFLFVEKITFNKKAECLLSISAVLFFFQEFIHETVYASFDQCDIPYVYECDREGQQYTYLCKWSAVQILTAAISWVIRFVLTLDDLANGTGRNDPESKLASSER